MFRYNIAKLTISLLFDIDMVGFVGLAMCDDLEKGQMG